jgi:hypothetical protein
MNVNGRKDMEKEDQKKHPHTISSTSAAKQRDQSQNSTTAAAPDSFLLLPIDSHPGEGLIITRSCQYEQTADHHRLGCVAGQQQKLDLARLLRALS